MGKIENSIEIEAPVEQVFAFYTDPKSWERAAPKDFEVKVEKTSAGPNGVGTTQSFSATVGGRKVEAVGEWVEYEENRRFGFRQIQGEMKKWEGAIRFEPTEKGTKVTTYVDYELPYWVLGMIMDKLVAGKDLQRLYSSFDDGAKEILEGA